MIAKAQPIILQSGFLGYHSDTYELPSGDTKADDLAEIKFGNIVTDEAKDFYFNRSVEEVFEEYINDPACLRSMEFRERILIAALDAFGTNSFMKWSVLQRSSKFLSVLHKRLLNETFEFITSGNRSVSIDAWGRLLSVRHTTAADRAVELDINKYFGREGYINSDIGVWELPSSIVEILALWTAKDGGFYDLMIFLNTVFGKNKQIHITSTKV